MDDESTSEGAFGARYAVIEHRGGGAMGSVYLVHDRERGARLALKTTHRSDPLSLALFRNEFRALADIDHRNLVRLYDLHHRDGEWFFTMEWIDGPDLTRWLRGAAPDALASTVPADGPTLPPTPTPEAGPAAPLPPPDGDRLTRAARQLVEGVGALHRHGLVHRDIKPTNIRVDRDDRLVLLDFGLVVRVDGTAGEGARGGWVAGTPGFMSPQQAAGARPTPADDWYGVGAVLCFALCGLRPDRGGRAALDPLARRAVDDAIGELARLALDLLTPDPPRRPAGDAIARRLGLPVSPLSRAAALVGRARELDTLRALVERRATAPLAVVHIRGPSGIGKSALVEGFIRTLPPSTVVLRGRSHRREDVPFGPFDAVIDDLARQLASWPRADVEAVLPRKAGALARLFPVLDRVPAFRDAPGRTLPLDDPRTLRSRGLGALRGMLGRLGDRRPLVLFLDDVQHGGADSAALLTALIGQSDPPPLILLACSRRADGSPLIDAIRHVEGAVDLPLDPLEPEAARALAASLLGIDPDHPHAARLAAQAGGHPFLLSELSVHAEGAPTEGLPSLAAAIRARVAGLPADARRLLELLALRDRPAPTRLLLRAADRVDAGQALLGTLRAARLVQGGLERDGAVHTAHDSIGEAVADGLAEAERPALHRAWGAVLEDESPPDHESLVRHWAGAGEPARAAGWAVRGGRAAIDATAFGQAVGLLERAIELGAAGPDALDGLARALTYAGRPSDAAVAWRRLADATAGAPRRAALRRAAEQHLIAAETAPGRALLDALGRELTLPRPRGRLRALIHIARALLSAWWRGLRRPDPQPGARAPGAIEAFDVHLAELNGWYGMSPLEILWICAGTYRAGLTADPRRRAVALAVGYMLVSPAPLPGRARSRAGLLRAARAATPPGTSGRALVQIARLVDLLRQGDGRSVLEAFDRLEDELGAAPTEHGWELLARRSLYCFVYNIAGRYRALAEQVPRWLDDARQRRARVEEAVILHVGGINVWLATDQPQRAEAALAAFGEQFDPTISFYMTALHRAGRLRVLRYRGASAAAVGLARDSLDWMRSATSPLGWQSGSLAFDAGSTALAALADGRPAGEVADVVLGAAALLEETGWRNARAWGAALRGGLAAGEGHARRAWRGLERAKRLFRNNGLIPPRMAPVLDYVEGHWRGDAPGEALAAAARETLRAQGVGDPDRWARCVFSAPLAPLRR